MRPSLAPDGSHAHATEDPYFLHRNKLRTYDFAMYAADLGEEFVAAACEVVRAQRTRAGTLRTWIDNYVIRFSEFLKALQDFRTAHPSFGDRAALFDEAVWCLFGSWYFGRLQKLPIAERTRTKQILTANKLLVILHREGVLTAKVPLNARGVIEETATKSRPVERVQVHKSMTNVPDSPFAFYVVRHGRGYDYTPFRGDSRLFLIQVVPALEKFFCTMSAQSAKRAHEAWLSLMTYLSSQRNVSDHQGFFTKLDSSDFRCLSKEAWEQLLYGWRQHLADLVAAGERKRSTQTASVKRLNAIWAVLADEGLVPDVHIREFKNAKSSYYLESRATLAQLPVVGKYNTDAARLTTDRLARFFDDSDQREVRGYIHALASKLSPELMRELPVEAVVEEIHALNSERLRTLRSCAEKDFLLWYSHWCQGRSAYNSVTLSGSEIVELVDGELRTVSETKQNSKALFLSGSDETRLGHILRYIEARHVGVIAGVRGRVHHLARSVGGKEKLTSYLHPHPHAAIALWVMVMIDTGANCEVARSIGWDCLLTLPDIRTTRKLVFGPKQRAGGKPVVDELPVARSDNQLSVVKAIEMYKEMATRLRALADPDSADFLLLHQCKGRVRQWTEWTARSRFIEFISGHEELRKYDIRPSMIRPSVLMAIQHINDYQVDAAQAVGDHKNATTTSLHYTGRMPTKLQYSLAIREFQNRFQSVIIVSIDGAAAKLGLSDEQFNLIFSEAARTGLGVACLDPLAGVQPGTRRGEYCTRFDACCDCRMRWVVATTDNIADLILFHEHIHASRPADESLGVDAWNDRWLPWLCFADVVIQKLRDSEFAGLYGRAVDVANQRRSEYVRIPME